jgi:hypothetical protein
MLQSPEFEAVEPHSCLIWQFYILIEVHRRFGGTYCLHFQALLVSQTSNEPVGNYGSVSKPRLPHAAHLVLAGSTMNMKAVLFSETSVRYHSTRRHIPKVSSPHSQCCGNLRSTIHTFCLVGITGVLGFVHCPVLKKTENTTFRKLHLYPSSSEGEDTYSVGYIRKN